MKIIVCPIDFSSGSENAALYASELANEFRARLILLHVYESPVIFTETSLEFAQTIELSIRSEAEKKIELLKSKLLQKNKENSIETKLVKEFIVQGICNVALNEDADMIVMGTTGRNKVERILLGSTSSKVFSEAKCPVLLIPLKTKYSRINKIAFATDLNEDNLQAVKQIVTFAKHFNSEILFVFVNDNSLLHSEEYISKMSQKIRSHINYNRIAGYIAENTSITGGIEYFVKKHSVDLLVMFNHNRHFPKSIINPSITGKMSQLSKIPLLSLAVTSNTPLEI